MKKHYSLTNKRIWIAGHTGMVGSSLIRALSAMDCEVITATRSELDLTQQQKVMAWVAVTKPDVIIIAAAKVGGIVANDNYPVEFLTTNILIQTNIFISAHANDVNRVLFLGSSCVYPRLANQPIQEDSLLSGYLEKTNQWYAIAKISGIMMARAYRKQYGRDYITCMPTNLYGPNDNFCLDTSHVMAALIVKAHKAKRLQNDNLEIWGTGKPRREFLYVNDMAEACIFLLENYSSEEIINIGSGTDISILNLAKMVSEIVGFNGNIIFDDTKPDGTPRKLLDTSKINTMGWSNSTGLLEGIRKTYKWYLSNIIRN
ncbi:MAG: GDP-fucose synthetase [Rhodospirillaceae bacterium]|nr:GDP-fucose synthetase [Rhodospirillaceae bacterium]